MMTTVRFFEAKNRLCELVERAARGEEIVITRRGEPVARLMPHPVPGPLAQAHALATRIRRSGICHVPGQERGQVQGPGDGTSIRDMIEEGRR